MQQTVFFLSPYAVEVLAQANWAAVGEATFVAVGALVSVFILLGK